MSEHGGLNAHVTANAERFTGLAEAYDSNRPRPPLAIVDLLAQLVGKVSPSLVVDLGSGTGLSTLIWSGRAAKVVGVEPNAEMRAKAEAQSAGLGNVRFVDGLGCRTGLPDACADIVTCSQSLHWMEPEPTFAEIARILVPGGIFGAYDCDWPPAINPEIDNAYAEFRMRAEKLQRARGVYDTVRRWPKDFHLARMRDSGVFSYVREVLLHNTEHGDAARIAGLALSQGGAATLLRLGVTESELGVDLLRAAAERSLGSDVVPWHIGYRVRVGIRQRTP